MLWLLHSDFTNPTRDDILAYAGVQDFDEAYAFLENKLTETGRVNDVWNNIEKPLVPVLMRSEDRGIKVDRKAIEGLEKKYRTELEAVGKRIYKAAGKEFNISSPKQLGEMLFVKMGLKAKNQKKTANGGFSTKESELEKLKEEHPIAGLVLEYRELSKLLGTYIDTMPTQVDKNNRLHSDFLQAGSATGRMASQNPNLQNIPNKTELGREIRKSFITEKGWKLVSFDYSQMELRIAAFLSGDKKLIEIFKKGLDVHTAVASEVFGVQGGEVTKTMRIKAKVINFGVMYGMGVTALQKNIGTGREEAQQFLDGYFNKFYGLAEYLEKVKRETEQKGYTETFFGRRRYFPDIHSKLQFLKAAAERMAINAPIQGTGADIIKLAMIEIDKFLEKRNLKNEARLLLQVHDELVYEIKDNLVKSLAPEIKNIMEEVIEPKKIFGIVCEADASFGDNWAEMEKIQ